MNLEDDGDSSSLSWWEKKQKNFREEVKTFNVEDCNGCRILGGGSLILAGFYVGFVGYKRAKLIGSRYGFIPSSVIASLFGVLGVLRLGGYNPFSSSGRSVGIDALEPLKERILKIQMESDMYKKVQQLRKEELEKMLDRQQVVEHIKQEKQEGRANNQNQTDVNVEPKDSAQSS